MSEALLSVRKSDLIDLGGNKRAVKFPKDSLTVLSVQPDGRYETRPFTAIGAWETASYFPKKLVFEVEGKFFTVLVIEEM